MQNPYVPVLMKPRDASDPGIQKAGDFLVIIDNMMNLKLLFWAIQVRGDSSFYKIAVTRGYTVNLCRLPPH